MNFSIFQNKPHPINITMKVNIGLPMQNALWEQYLHIQWVHIECMYVPN